jgi:hypothetical protein
MMSEEKEILLLYVVVALFILYLIIGYDKCTNLEIYNNNFYTCLGNWLKFGV